MNDESPVPIGDLDSLDQAIVALLREDGRLSNAAISRQVGVSQTTVKKRIDRLVEKNVMRVIAVLDPSAVYHGAHLFVGITVKPGRASAVAEALAELREVAYLAVLVGRYDILIEIFAPDSEDYLQHVSERIAKVPDILTLETFSVLRNQKVSYYNWNLRNGVPMALRDERGPS